jgi:hypothetical protein
VEPQRGFFHRLAVGARTWSRCGLVALVVDLDCPAGHTPELAPRRFPVFCSTFDTPWLAAGYFISAPFAILCLVAKILKHESTTKR